MESPVSTQQFGDDKRMSIAKCLQTSKSVDMAQNDSLVSPVDGTYRKEARMRKPSWKKLCAEMSESDQHRHTTAASHTSQRYDIKTLPSEYGWEKHSTRKSAKEKRIIHCDKVQVDTLEMMNNKKKSFTDSKIRVNHPTGRTNSQGKMNKTYLCSVCGCSLRSPSDLRNHVLVHNGEKPYECNICGKCFVRSSGLNYHLRTHTNVNPHKCEQCDIRFTSSSNLKKHMLTHTDIKPHVCPTCNQAFRQKGNLKTHMRTHTGDKPHKCKTCEKCFSNQSNLNGHMKVHTLEKPYQCTTCGKSFSHPTVLRNHQRTHTGEKPYMCSSCGKSFGHICTLQKHMLIHTGEKPHKCSVCGTAFRQSGQLQMHMYSHTGNKPHECSSCGKTFGNKSKLRIHMSVHSGGKGHKCPVCNRSYRYTESLRQHTKSAHRKTQSFTCQSCDVDFKTKNKLDVHMQSHTEDSMHICMTCGKTFPQSIRLQEHMRTHQKPIESKTQNTLSSSENASEFKAEPELDAHVHRHPRVEDPLHVCMKQGQTFTQSNSMEEHAEIHAESSQSNKVTYTTESCLTWKTDHIPEGVYIIYDDDDIAGENFDHVIITEDTPCVDKLDTVEEILSENPQNMTSFLTDLAKISQNEHRYPWTHLDRDLVSVEVVSQETDIKQETIKHEQMEYEENAPTKEVLILQDSVNEGDVIVSSDNNNFEELIHDEMRSKKPVYEIIPTSTLVAREGDIVTHSEEDRDGEDAQVIYTVHEKENPHIDIPSQKDGRTLIESAYKVASKSIDCNSVTPTKDLTIDTYKQKIGINLNKEVEVHVKLDKLSTNMPNYDGDRVTREEQIPPKKRNNGKCKKTHKVEWESKTMITRSSKQKKPQGDLPHFGKKIVKKDINNVEFDSTNKPHICETCSRGFRWANDLRNHKRTHTGERPFICPTCGKSFSRSNQLCDHIRTHTGEKPHKCPHDTCSMAFVTSSNLKAHLLTHTDKKPFSCSECDQTYRGADQLRRHKRTHTGEKPFICSYCGKGFTCNNYLKQHLMTHTGVKPYQCSTCGKRFTHQTVLHNHMRTHTGARPYHCKECNKSFGHNCTLQKHMLIHTGEKPHKCATCGKGFRQSGQLQVHTLTHTGVKPFGCYFCDKTFTSKQKMQRHSERHAVVPNDLVVTEDNPIKDEISLDDSSTASCVTMNCEPAQVAEHFQLTTEQGQETVYIVDITET